MSDVCFVACEYPKSTSTAPHVLLPPFLDRYRIFKYISNSKIIVMEPCLRSDLRVSKVDCIKRHVRFCLLLRRYSSLLVIFDTETQNHWTQNTCPFSVLRISKIHVENTVCCSSNPNPCFLLMSIYELFAYIRISASNFQPISSLHTFESRSQNLKNSRPASMSVLLCLRSQK